MNDDTEVDEKTIFELVRHTSLDIMMNMIRVDLLKLGIKMDVYTSEKEIISGNLLSDVISILEKRKLIYYGTLLPPKGIDPKNWEQRK